VSAEKHVGAAPAFVAKSSIKSACRKIERAYCNSIPKISIPKNLKTGSNARENISELQRKHLCIHPKFMPKNALIFLQKMKNEKNKWTAGNYLVPPLSEGLVI
jgi:hypothetical protein